MRLSSISSQDSGFTSQDTLFLPRPSSPSSRMKVIENTDDINCNSALYLLPRSRSHPIVLRRKYQIIIQEIFG